MIAISLICRIVCPQNFSPRYLLGKPIQTPNSYGAGITAKGKINSGGNTWEMLEKTTESSNPPQAPMPNLQGAGKNIPGMCTSPWWQRPEITHCSCATLRNASNPGSESQPFPKISGAVTDCRNRCWMVVLPRQVTPDQEKHLAIILGRQMVLYCCHFQQAGMGWWWEKGMQRSSPINIHTSNCWLWWCGD